MEIQFYPHWQITETHGVGQANVLLLMVFIKCGISEMLGGNHKYVMYAESNDGVNWNRPYSNPVLFPGVSGTWDDLAVHPAQSFMTMGLLYVLFWLV